MALPKFKYADGSFNSTAHAEIKKLKKKVKKLKRRLKALEGER